MTHLLTQEERDTFFLDTITKYQQADKSISEVTLVQALITDPSEEVIRSYFLNTTPQVRVYLVHYAATRGLVNLLKEGLKNRAPRVKVASMYALSVFDYEHVLNTFIGTDKATEIIALIHGATISNRDEVIEFFIQDKKGVVELNNSVSGISTYLQNALIKFNMLEELEELVRKTTAYEGAKYFANLRKFDLLIEVLKNYLDQWVDFGKSTNYFSHVARLLLEHKQMTEELLELIKKRNKQQIGISSNDSFIDVPFLYYKSLNDFNGMFSYLLELVEIATEIDQDTGFYQILVERYFKWYNLESTLLTNENQYNSYNRDRYY